MVIVNIKNGLGNQMFQYTFGRVLSLKYGVNVLFDFMRENHSSPLTTELYVFNIDDIVEPSIIDVTPFKPFSISNYKNDKKYIKYIFYKFRRLLHPCKLVIESHPSQFTTYFNGLDTNKRYYFLGFWQNPRYFTNYENEIRKIFIPKDLSIYESPLALNIKNNKFTSISLHIRRGDYLTCGFMQPADMNFYIDAIQFIKSKIPNPFFYIFTDDKEWVESEFKINIPFELVQGNEGINSYKDILLMSLCKHHIIANSSFSWWGAWLNPNPDKIVIAPKKWYATAKSDKYITEITPKEWIRL